MHLLTSDKDWANIAHDLLLLKQLAASEKLTPKMDLMCALVHIANIAEELDTANPVRDAYMLVLLYYSMFNNTNFYAKLLKNPKTGTIRTKQQYETKTTSEFLFSTEALESLRANGYILYSKPTSEVTGADISFTERLRSMFISKVAIHDDILTIYPIVTKIGTRLINVPSGYITKDSFITDYKSIVVSIENHLKLVSYILRGKELGVAFMSLFDFLQGGWRYYEVLFGAVTDQILKEFNDLLMDNYIYLRESYDKYKPQV